MYNTSHNAQILHSDPGPRYTTKHSAILILGRSTAPYIITSIMTSSILVRILSTALFQKNSIDIQVNFCSLIGKLLHCHILCLKIVKNL